MASAALSVFSRPTSPVAMDDLPVQVGERHDVVVDDPEGPDAGAGEILQRRRAKTSGADDKDARGLQPVLPRSADAAQHDLTRVALDFFAGEAHAGPSLHGGRPRAIVRGQTGRSEIHDR